MENDIKIIQMVPEQWTNTEGKIRTDVLGLGDDGMVYRWFRGSGKWILNIRTDN